MDNCYTQEELTEKIFKENAKIKQIFGQLLTFSDKYRKYKGYSKDDFIYDIEVLIKEYIETQTEKE